MKAFRFRLDQALRWREQRVRLDEARLAASGARVAALRARKDDCERLALNAARDVMSSRSTAGFQSYEAFKRVSRRQAELLLQQEKAALSEYAACMAQLVEASRKARLLEKLRDADLRKWQGDADRELSDFATEAFLTRHASRRRADARDSAALPRPQVAQPTTTL